MSILARIRAHGGDVIRDRWMFRLRRGGLSDEAVAWLRAHRARVIREIWPDHDDWEERAAIREYDGGQPRPDAERDAWREIEGRRSCF